jgi:hypothetical protein
MKIRIKGNSIRFRLLRSEVESLSERGSVAGSTAFGPGDVFRYTVSVGRDAEAIVATFEHGEIAVTLPAGTAREWATSDQVGIETVQQTGDGEVLEVLVEKDFVCLSRDDADRGDAFPNPNGPCE